MTKENLIEKAKEMIAAPSCCPELHAAGHAWIESIGKADEHERAENLIAEIQEDINSIEDLEAFAKSAMAEKIFGEGVEDFRKHVADLKESGAKFCDCGACASAAIILDNKAVILG